MYSHRVNNKQTNNTTYSHRVNNGFVETAEALPSLEVVDLEVDTAEVGLEAVSRLLHLEVEVAVRGGGRGGEGEGGERGGEGTFASIPSRHTLI